MQNQPTSQNEPSGSRIRRAVPLMIILGLVAMLAFLVSMANDSDEPLGNPNADAAVQPAFSYEIHGNSANGYGVTGESSGDEYRFAAETVPADASAAKDYGKAIAFDPGIYSGVYAKKIDLVLYEPIAFQLKDGEYSVLGTIAPNPRVSMNCWNDRCYLNIDKDKSGALISADADKKLSRALAEKRSIFFSLGTNGYTIYSQRPDKSGSRK